MGSLLSANKSPDAFEIHEAHNSTEHGNLYGQSRGCGVLKHGHCLTMQQGHGRLSRQKYIAECHQDNTAQDHQIAQVKQNLQTGKSHRKHLTVWMKTERQAVLFFVCVVCVCEL